MHYVLAQFARLRKLGKGIIATFDAACTKCTLCFDEAAFLVLRHGLNCRLYCRQGPFRPATFAQMLITTLGQVQTKGTWGVTLW